MFPKLIAADKTKYIELLDRCPKYQYLFLRPRRWGKSTFLDTLANYYDKSKQEFFNDSFRDLYIGKHPTSSRSSLLILRFDFSSIGALDAIESMKECFHRYMSHQLKTFIKRNESFLEPIDSLSLNKEDGPQSLREVLVSRADSHGSVAELRRCRSW